MAGFGVESEQPYAPIWVAVVVGVALVSVPTLVSEIVWPRWATTGVSSTADSGVALFGALLGLSGLFVAIFGAWVGASVGFDAVGRFMLAMYGGVVFATAVSITFLGRYGAPHETLFLAVFFAVLVGIPFWILAGVGLGIGSTIHNSRTP